jgi:hypothetical protein
MKGSLLLTMLLGCCLAIAECNKQGVPGPLTPQQAAQNRHAIVNYMECEECDDGELEAVVKLGTLAIPTLVAILREGPSPSQIEMLRRHLTTTYRELKAYELTHPDAAVPGTEEQYVKTYLSNYVARYQIRAARALGKIGGPEARRALEEASLAPLRDDVRNVVKAALDRLVP